MGSHGVGVHEPNQYLPPLSGGLMYMVNMHTRLEACTVRQSGSTRSVIQRHTAITVERAKRCSFTVTQLGARHQEKYHTSCFGIDP